MMNDKSITHSWDTCVYFFTLLFPMARQDKIMLLWTPFLDWVINRLFIKRICLCYGICLLGLSLAPAGVYGDPVVYRLGINEEMPSNHIYHMLVDRYGYLWMATSHSVVRYNGYETKTFDLSSGLPSNDIWGLHEDNRGRIWVLCFCHVLGYIFNDEFRPVALENPPSRLYPRIWNVRDHIILHSQQDDRSRGTMYFETGEKMPGAQFNRIHWAYYDSTRNELFYMTYVLHHGRGFRLHKAKITPGHIVRQIHHPEIIYEKGHEESFVFDKYYMYMQAGERDRVHAFNIVDAVSSVIHLNDSGHNTGSKIFNRNRNMLWLYSGDYLYEFNEHLAETNVSSVPPFIRSLPVSSVLYDRLWGSCFGTAGEGLYIAESKERGLRLPAFLMPSGYRYVGQPKDRISFWWNQWGKRLLRTDSAGKMVHMQYAPDINVMKIVPWTSSHSLVLDINSLYLLDHQTGKYRPFIQDKHLDRHNPPGINEFLTNRTGLRNLDLVAGDVHEFFLLTRSGIYRFYEDQDTIRVRLIEPADRVHRDESYVNITYDPFRKTLWAYNNNTVLKYDQGGQAQVYKNESQIAPAVRNVEQVLIDKRYGTLFLKEFDRIRVHDMYGQRFKTVYPGINLRKTVACIEDDLLVVAGKFGVAVSRILGYGRLSPPVVYRHIKNLQYSDVYDVQIIGDEVIMTTNKGLLSVPVPDSMAFAKQRAVPTQNYRVLLGYNGLLRTIVSGDTLHVDQADMKLRFDVVRPSGSGILRCAYFLSGTDEKWNLLAGKELLLPPLKPGSTTRMLLRFSDDVWISDPVAIDLYVTPYWWQTVSARRVIWGSAVLGFLGLIAASVWITRRIVVSNNQRRNAHMEIELKALYAQINPHFIFNTLNTALFFIESRKIEDAHTHVSRFSHLLRSYIKSSRNRFVTIAEEIENLHNYIGLQQIRFWDKFDYKILLEDGIEANRVRIPALLFQPIVENAIHHGLFHKKEKGFLNIHFKNGEAHQEIICIIEDDGVGRKQSQEFRRSSTLKKNESYGDQLIEDLIRIFNKYEGMDIRITYHDKEPPLTGTIVTLYIKKAL